MNVGRLNPVGAGLVILGGLAGLISIFLPIYQDGTVFSTVQDNSLVQSDTGSGIAFRYAVCSIAAAGLLWRYQTRQRTNWGVMVWGLLLAGGAIVDLSSKSNFELVGVNDPTVQFTAQPGIAWYVALVGGALIAIGGFMVWRRSEEELPVTPEAPEAPGAFAPPVGPIPTPQFVAPGVPSPGVTGGPDTATQTMPAAEQREKKRCPACAEDVWAEAQVCRYCGHEFADNESPRSAG